MLFLKFFNFQNLFPDSYLLSIHLWFYLIEFGENQTLSTDYSEDDIVEKSKIAQLGQFNDISNGNTSTLFYGGIVFPPEFNYDDETTRSCTSEKCTNMNYTIRLGVNYVQFDTDSMYSIGAGPSGSGIIIEMKKVIFRLTSFFSFQMIYMLPINSFFTRK